METKTKDQVLHEFDLRRKLLKLIDECVEIQVELKLREKGFYDKEGIK